VARMVCVAIDPDSSRRSLELAESFPRRVRHGGHAPAHGLGARPGGPAVIEELLAEPMVVGWRDRPGLLPEALAGGGSANSRFEPTSPCPGDRKPLWSTSGSVGRRAADLAEEEADRWSCTVSRAPWRSPTRRPTAGTTFLCGERDLPERAPPSGGRRRGAEDRLLTETDSPFLSPQSMRGQPNSPSNVLAVVRSLAEERGVDLQRMVERTASSAPTRSRSPVEAPPPRSTSSNAVRIQLAPGLRLC